MKTTKTATTIWKFPLSIQESPQFIDMPRGAEILSAQTQGNLLPQLWAKVNPANGKVARMIYVIGTGWQIEKSVALGRFIGTIQQNSGALIWHVFDGGEVA